MKKVNEKGFTLAELLIVVAVIAVLVAVAIPTFSDQLEKARQATDIANLRDAYSVARLAELENSVDGVAIKSVKNDNADKPETFTYYFNAGTGKLVAYTDPTIAAANGTKMKAQTKTLKVDANESVYYSYYNAGTTKTTTGPVDSVMKYLLTVDTSEAILKVTFLETGVNTMDFNLQSVTYVDPTLGNLKITNPGTTPGTLNISEDKTVTDTPVEIGDLPLPKYDDNSTEKAADVKNLTFSKMSGPSWLAFKAASGETDANKLVTIETITRGEKVATYPVSIFVIDDDGRTGTYSFNIEVAKNS